MPLGFETPPAPAISPGGDDGEGHGEQPPPVAPMAPMEPVAELILLVVCEAVAATGWQNPDAKIIRLTAMNGFFFYDAPDPQGDLLPFEAHNWPAPYSDNPPHEPAAAASADALAAMDGGDDDFDILFGEFMSAGADDDPASPGPAAGITHGLSSGEPATAIAGPAMPPAPALPPAPAASALNPASATAPVLGLSPGTGLPPVPGQPHAMGQLPASVPYAVAAPGVLAHPAPGAAQGLRPPGFRVQDNMVLRHDWPQGPLYPPQKHGTYERSNRPKPPQDNCAWCNSCEHWLWTHCYERTPLGARDTSRCCNRCHWRRRRELGLNEWMRLAQPRMMHLIRRDPGYSA
ncbi:LOW QUALITY PROTEIN: hypothetical protein ColTof4_03723 [Colletotrichum tofieldiae]|nr:LOW QUALITY PROTEIN: hypothetical protein ColTof3_12850 [Colletotrichum tofieldiae]GKT71300.1 LOW QUALITY PROTEIN: hypothetical protein ColTof4_03723 [Colletotrichum tofieldiae]